MDIVFFLKFFDFILATIYCLQMYRLSGYGTDALDDLISG